MAWDNQTILPHLWPPAQGMPFCCCFLLDLICFHRWCKAKGHLCVGCHKDTGDFIIVWSTVCGLIGDRDWMISSPLRMSNLDIFPRSVCLPRMSSPLSPLLLTLKIELVLRSSHSGDYSEVGAQSLGLARTATEGLGDIVKHGMRTDFITCCASSYFFSKCTHAQEKQKVSPSPAHLSWVPQHFDVLLILKHKTLLKHKTPVQLFFRDVTVPGFCVVYMLFWKHSGCL